MPSFAALIHLEVPCDKKVIVYLYNFQPSRLQQRFKSCQLGIHNLQHGKEPFDA